MSRPLVVAHGQYAKLFAFVVVVVLGYVGWTILQPYLVAYQVKVAVKAACVDKSRDTKWGMSEEKQTWETNFLRKCNRLQVKFEDEDTAGYSFDVKAGGPRGRDYTCEARVWWESYTGWGIIDDFLEEPIKPFHTKHEVELSTEVKDKF